MSDDAANDSWGSALALYDELAASGWSHIPGFRSLVAVLAGSEAIRGLTAVTSHEVLTISPYARCPDWFEGRRLRLEPLADGRVRVTDYSGLRPEEWTLTLDEARAKVLRIAAAL